MEPVDCLKVLTRSVFCIIPAQLKLTHYPGVCSRNICYMRDVELHEPLFTALPFHLRSVASAVSAALCSDGDHDDGISSYNEAFAARSNSSSQF